jgi:hypothetical protein
MNQPQDTNAWSLYWSEDRLYSCVAQSSVEDQKVLNMLWQGFSQKLAPGSRVLDLATGNGAVADALISTNSGLKIDAIDKASIDPKRFLKEQGNLLNVNFHADTDIFDLPFKSSTFDVITSQFGIEYAGFENASIKVIDYLKIGGHFQFVVHHAESGIILSSKDKIIELQRLTDKSGILETLIKVLGGKAEFSELETLGEAYLKQDIVRSQQISGQIFIGIERIINKFATHPRESLDLGVAMDLRVRSELARLRQLIAAGQTVDAMQAWSERMLASGVEPVISPLYLDPKKQDYLLAWLVSGSRRK